jgi:hypothetical protein
LKVKNGIEQTLKDNKVPIDIIPRLLKHIEDAGLFGDVQGITELLQNNVSNNANVDLRKFSSNKQDILIFDNGGVTFGSAFTNQSKEVLF